MNIKQMARKELDLRKEEKTMVKSYYLLDEATDYLGIGRNAMLRLVKKEGFPSFKLAGKWRISKKGLEEWIEAQTNK